MNYKVGLFLMIIVTSLTVFASCSSKPQEARISCGLLNASTKYVGEGNGYYILEDQELDGSPIRVQVPISTCILFRK